MISSPNQPHLGTGVSGLCELPQACPKACTRSSDCNTAQGELCCNGFCSDAGSCPKTCSSDNDCATDNGQLCCNNPVLGSPWWGWQERTGSSGGSGSGSGSGGGGACGLSLGNSACDQCIDQSCCSQDSACAQNTECNALVHCLEACAGNSTCQQTCEQQYSGGLSMLQPLVQCMQQDCSSQCGGSGSTSGGGASNFGAPCAFASDCTGGGECCAANSSSCGQPGGGVCVTQCSSVACP